MGGLRVLIGCNSRDSGSVELSGELCALFRRAGITPCVCGADADLSDVIDADYAESPSGCTHVVTVGGDGTILKWGKIAARYDIPLLGVNMGRLGFMATLERSEAASVPDILMSDHPVSRRMLISCEILRENGGVENRTVLNDVVISRDSGSKLPEFGVSCGGAEVLRVRADGVILSTPTGSTAYSLSAGGPIIAPELECVELTALCPHTLFNRPMIFSADKAVTVRVNVYQNSRVTVSTDGERNIPFADGDILRLSRSEKTLKLIETGSGFYGAVHNKLMTPLK